MPGKHASSVASPFGMRIPLAIWRTAWTLFIVVVSATAVIAWVSWLRPPVPNGRPHRVLPPVVPPVLPSPTGSAPGVLLSAPVPSLPAPTAVTASGTAGPVPTGTAATTGPATAPAPAGSTPARRPTPIAIAPPELPEATTEPPTARPTSTTEVAALSASYQVASSWSDGFVTQVRVTNTTTRASSWTVSVTFPADAGVDVVQYWNAKITQDGDTSVFAGGSLAPGDSVTFGFNASKETTDRVTPSGCTVSGAACSVS